MALIAQGVAHQIGDVGPNVQYHLAIILKGSTFSTRVNLLSGEEEMVVSTLGLVDSKEKQR